MAIGTACKARDLSRGDVIGFYKGGVYQHLGRITTIQVMRTRVMFRVDFQSAPHLVNATTVFRVHPPEVTLV